MKTGKAHLSLIAILAVAISLAGCSSTAPGTSVLASGDEPEKDSNGAFRCRTPLNEDGLVDEVFDLIQMERDREGLPPLVLDPMLAAIADDYACRMIEGDFFAHVDPDSGDGPGARVTRGGYVFLSVGENLAAGQRTPVDVVEQWMDSPGHRDNILGSFWRETGVAVRAGGDYGVYWVQIFADPVDFGPPPPDAVIASSAEPETGQ